jgi:hypothetical protein
MAMDGRPADASPGAADPVFPLPARLPPVRPLLVKSSSAPAARRFRKKFRIVPES